MKTTEQKIIVRCKHCGWRILDIVDFIWVDGKRRIKRESFDKWYGSQTKYNKVKEIEEVENYVD